MPSSEFDRVSDIGIRRKGPELFMTPWVQMLSSTRTGGKLSENEATAMCFTNFKFPNKETVFDLTKRDNTIPIHL